MEWAGSAVELEHGLNMAVVSVLHAASALSLVFPCNILLKGVTGTALHWG